MNRLKQCRLCLAETVTSYSLLEQTRASILEALTSIKVEDNDTLPKNACLKCWLNLKLAYGIQQKFLAANRKLQASQSKYLDQEDWNPFEEIAEENEEEKEIMDEEYNIVKMEEEDETEIINIIPNISNSSRKSPLDFENIKLENCTDSEILVVYNTKADIVKSEDNIQTRNAACQICGQRVEEQILMDHIKTHYSTRMQCDECYTFCEDIKSYRKHMLLQHNEINQRWTCKLCHSTFLYKPLYNIHIAKAHEKMTGKTITDSSHNCSYCHKKFRTEEKLLVHIKTHARKECNVCGMKITPSNFKKHVEMHTSDPVVCHLCGSTYKNSISLRSHLHYTHSNRTYKCTHCENVYKKSYDLVMHVKREHTGEKSHVCDICGKSFFTFYTMNKHKKMTHMKLRPYQCPFCKKKFSSKHALVTHERQHTNITPYACEVCGEGFRQKVSLKAHRKSKHNIVDPDTCECKVCGKKFGSSFAVISHMRLH